jgi:hypothetical protein
MDTEDKMLDIDEGPSAPSKAYQEKKAKEQQEEMQKVEKSLEDNLEKKKTIEAEKLYQVIKALTAMKLTKEDKMPG